MYYLRTSHTHTLRDLMRTDQVIHINFFPHEGSLGNPCCKVVYARTQPYYVSKNKLSNDSKMTGKLKGLVI